MARVPSLGYCVLYFMEIEARSREVRMIHPTAALERTFTLYRTL